MEKNREEYWAQGLCECVFARVLCVLLRGAEKVTLGGCLKEMNGSHARIRGKALQVEVCSGERACRVWGQRAGRCA